MLRPHPSARFLVLSSLVFLTLAAACNFEPAPPTLRVQMFQIDGAAKEIAVSLNKPDTYGGIAEKARMIAELAQDEAFDRYELKPSYPLSPNDFDTFRSFRSALGERAKSLEEAARSGDPAAVSSGYVQLQFMCQTCHSKFRPGL